MIVIEEEEFTKHEVHLVKSPCGVMQRCNETTKKDPFASGRQATLLLPGFCKPNKAQMASLRLSFFAMIYAAPPTNFCTAEVGQIRG